jgi:hypothetical protein
MRLALAQYLGKVRKILTLPGARASSKTDILEVKFIGDEVWVCTRGAVRLTVSGRARTTEGATQDDRIECDGNDG